MEELNPVLWRGRGLIQQRDHDGRMCTGILGDKPLLFVPVTVEPNSTYRIILEIHKDGGNGKLYCNFYANRSFDFPQVGFTCESDRWALYDVQMLTGSFPPNLPMMFRIWRSPGGTGSLLVRSIHLEKLTSSNARPPTMVSFAEAGLPAPCSETPAQNSVLLAGHPHMTRSVMRPRGAHAFSPLFAGAISGPGTFDGPAERMFVVIESQGELEPMRAAFSACNLGVDGFVATHGQDDRLMQATSQPGLGWIHINIQRPTSVTPQLIGRLRAQHPQAVVTAYGVSGWPIVDEGLAEVFRKVDVAFVGNESEASAYRDVGCHNMGVWYPGVDLGIFHAMTNRSSLREQSEYDIVLFTEPGRASNPVVEDVVSTLREAFGEKLAV